jgi:hypothetical protein
MNDLTYWTKKLREAERELNAATRRSEVSLAASRLMSIKAELKRLEQRTPTRQASGIAGLVAFS